MMQMVQSSIHPLEINISFRLDFIDFRHIYPAATIMRASGEPPREHLQDFMFSGV